MNVSIDLLSAVAGIVVAVVIFGIFEVSAFASWYELRRYKKIQADILWVVHLISFGIIACILIIVSIDSSIRPTISQFFSVLAVIIIVIMFYMASLIILIVGAVFMPKQSKKENSHQEIPSKIS